jgi:hypothetical protein
MPTSQDAVRAPPRGSRLKAADFGLQAGDQDRHRLIRAIFMAQPGSLVLDNPLLVWEMRFALPEPSKLTGPPEARLKTSC